MTERSLYWNDGTGDGGPYSQDQLRMFANVLGLASGADIGVIPSQLNMLVPSSNGDNKIGADTGYAIVDGTLYENDAAKELTVASPSSATTGVRLSLRKVWADREIRLTATKNTDGNAAIPSLTQSDGTTWDIPIATFTITTGGVIADLTDVREFTREATINIGFGVTGEALATGVYYGLQFEVPADCFLLAWTIVADQSGDCVIDFWMDTYANYPPTNADTITGANEPALSSAQKAQNTSPTDWTRVWEKGDFIVPNVDSATTVEVVHVTLRVALL